MKQISGIICKNKITVKCIELVMQKVIITLKFKSKVKTFASSFLLKNKLSSEEQLFRSSYYFPN